MIDIGTPRGGTAVPADEIDIVGVMADLRQEAVRKSNIVSFKIAQKPGNRPASVKKKTRHGRTGAARNVVQYTVDLRPLLRLDGSEFIRKAYIKMLGRRPDPAGSAFFLSRLDGGWAGKIGVLQALRASEEGRARNLRVPGLTFTILCRYLFSAPELRLRDLLVFDGLDFINNAYRQVLGREADSTGFANLLGRLDGRWVGKVDVLAALRFSQEGRARNTRIGGLFFARVRKKLFSARYVRLKDLMRYDGEEFVFNAYRQVLGREPDSGGYASQLKQLEHGWAGKIRVLANFRSSPEGRARNIRIRGLGFAIVLKNLYLGIISFPRRIGGAFIGRVSGRPGAGAIGREDMADISKESGVN